MVSTTVVIINLRYKMFNIQKYNLTSFFTTRTITFKSNLSKKNILGSRIDIITY